MGKVTLKIVQKYEARADGKKNVRLRITADRIVRFSSTDVYVPESAFNKKGKRENSNWIRSTHPNSHVYNDIIDQKWDQALLILKEVGQTASADEVQKRLEASDQLETEPLRPTLPGFVEYAERYVQRRGESATSDTYRDATKAFVRFLKQEYKQADVSFAELTIAFVKEWRAWALATFKNNTAWMYHSRLKSLYLQAIEDVDGLTSIPTVVSDPFRRVKIPKQKTQKKRLYEDEIERLSALELPFGGAKRRARDLCLMMYYAHGMRVGDALRLRASNYVVIPTSDGEEHRLIYTMGKTDKPKNVLLPDVAIKLLEPYRLSCEKPSDTLFPYLRRHMDKGYDDYTMRLKIKSKVVLIRDSLLELAKLASIDKHLSAHVFRHSFADLARRSKMDVIQIQKALGHDQISTTQGYLEELDQSSVDEVKNLFK